MSNFLCFNEIQTGFGLLAGSYGISLMASIFGKEIPAWLLISLVLHIEHEHVSEVYRLCQL
jgi:hypothetical protein